MASMTIKATYSLDPQTVRLLERMAERWKVSRSEALRRAIRAAGNGAASSTSEEAKKRLQTLDALQRSAGLSKSQAIRWAKNVRQERMAATKRIKTRSR